MTLGLADEQLKKQLVNQIAGLNTQAAALPQSSGVAVNPVAPTATATSGVQETLNKWAPLAASIGAGLAKGGPLEGATQAIAGSVQGQAVGRERQKILDLLKGTPAPGTSGGLASFTGGSETPSFKGVSTLGLTPEQVTHLYDTVETQRLTERKWPLEVMNVVGDLYNKVMVGDYHAAQIPYIKAQTEKMQLESQNLPAIQRLEVEKRIQEIHETIAKTQKAQAETGAIPAETGLKQAQTEESKARRAGMPPSFEAETQAKLRVAQAEPFQPVATEQNITVIDKRTGQPTVTIPISKAFTSTQTNMAYTQTMGNFIGKAKASIDIKYGADVQGAKRAWDNLTYTLGKEDLTGNLHAEVILDALSPADRVIFGRVLTLFREGEQYGISVDDTQKRVNAILGIKPTAEGAPTKGLREKGQAPAPAAPAAAAPTTGPKAVNAANFGPKYGIYEYPTGSGNYYRAGAGKTPVSIEAPAPTGAVKPAAKPTPKSAETKKPKPIGLGGEAWQGKSWKERMGGK
jgi:hypothetical protein